MADQKQGIEALVLAQPNPKEGFVRGLVTFCRHLSIHRQLIWGLCMRDIRLKYRGSAFGYFWSLLDPLLMALTFVMFGMLLGRGGKDDAHTLLVVVGVITYGFFSAAAQRGQGSLTTNAGLIEAIYVPREIFGVAAIYAQLFMTMLSLLVAIPFLIYLQILPSWEIVIYIPVGLILVMFFATGLGMGSAPWNVLNRDVEYFFTFITRAGMYLSPVMWDIDDSMISGKMRSIVLWNPLCVPMEMIKKGMTGRPLNISNFHIAYSCITCTVIFIWGLAEFRRREGIVVKKL
jgi:ABC-type polysaccharide/polyol phosphate export permease